MLGIDKSFIEECIPNELSFLFDFKEKQHQTVSLIYHAKTYYSMSNFDMISI